MRFLVLGASGMAGHTIALYLVEQGHEVAGFSRRDVSFLGSNQVRGDARDEQLLSKVLFEGDYDVVVNCVGVLNQHAEDNPEDASFLNGELPHVLARLTKNSRTRVFQMSTDCVFAGNTGPYSEDSVPDGETVYDQTKAAGELRDAKNLTFRNSIIGPDMNPSGIGLLNWFMMQRGPIRGYGNAIWTGLTTLELAKAMECAAQENASGLVNMVPPCSISKLDLLRMLNRCLRDDSIEIIPFEDFKLDKTLVRTDFSCSYCPRNYVDQVVQMAEWVREHASLYPHYMLG